MPKFHTLQVKEVRTETPDCVSIAFDVPDALKADYTFTQGQYLTLKTDINGEDVRRSYSICSSPFEEELRVAVKHVEDGRFSTFANQKLQAGDTLDVMTPMGKFYTELDENNEKQYIAFAAGSGITPVMSILKAVLKVEPKSSFTLFYGNRNFESIIFREAIEALKNKYLERLSVHHVLSREVLGSPLFNGRINGEKCQQFCKAFFDVEQVDDYFLCGPEDMIFSVKDTLEEKGVDKKRIHFELFTTPTTKAAKTKKTKITTPLPSKSDSQITVILDGDAFDFSLHANGDNILDTALKNGADLPFACKGGVCCTCRAKILEGEVEMDVNYALEPDEVAAGFVLTCQSHPRTKKVVVSFDEK